MGPLVALPNRTLGPRLFPGFPGRVGVWQVLRSSPSNGGASGTTVNKSACSKQAMYGSNHCLNDLAWNCTEVGKGNRASGCNETLEEAPSTMAREVKFSDRHMTI